MIDYHYWTLFFTAAIALNISPGPDLVFILTKTVTQGKRVGVAATFGVCTGAFFHVIAASVGISLILTKSPFAFSTVQYIGAAYLLYLGFQAFRTSSTETDITCNRDRGREGPMEVFKQGVAIDILNPKVAVFFIAFLPQFVRDEHGSVSFQLFYLGTLIIAVSVIVETALVFFTYRIGKQLGGNSKFGAWSDRLVGVIFVGLAINLLIKTIH